MGDNQVGETTGARKYVAALAVLLAVTASISSRGSTESAETFSCAATSLLRMLAKDTDAL